MSEATDIENGRPQLEWDSVGDRGDLNAEVVAQRDRLADAARAARWDDLIGVLDETDEPHGAFMSVNSVRIGGTSGFAPLHQAAWHGANVDIVVDLLERGAWRSLRTTHGETAEDVARRRGHERVADAVALPAEFSSGTRLADMETYLAALITVRARELKKTLRMPQLGPLQEIPAASFYCSIAGMYGGFAYEWLDPDDRTVLQVSSWSRVVGGSGQEHHITDNGIVLVEKGFV